MRKEFLYGIIGFVVFALLGIGLYFSFISKNKVADKNQTDVTKDKAEAVKTEKSLIPKTIPATGTESKENTAKFEKSADNQTSGLAVGAIKEVSDTSVTIASDDGDVVLTLSATTVYQAKDMSKTTKAALNKGIAVEALFSGKNATNITLQ